MASPDADPRSGDALTQADIPELVKAVVEAMKAGHPAQGTSKCTSTDTGEPFVCVTGMPTKYYTDSIMPCCCWWIHPPSARLRFCNPHNYAGWAFLPPTATQAQIHVCCLLRHFPPSSSGGPPGWHT